jgi:hypothetical protein
MEDETCFCEKHGQQQIAFVCYHVTAASKGETVGFVSSRPDDENDLRDAWCEACDVYLQAHGGDWVDGVAEVPDGISLICAECYRAREQDALRAHRRVYYER